MLCVNPTTRASSAENVLVPVCMSTCVELPGSCSTHLFGLAWGFIYHRHNVGFKILGFSSWWSSFSGSSNSEVNNCSPIGCICAGCLITIDTYVVLFCEYPIFDCRLIVSWITYEVLAFNDGQYGHLHYAIIARSLGLLVPTTHPF